MGSSPKQRSCLFKNAADSNNLVLNFKWKIKNKVLSLRESYLFYLCGIHHGNETPSSLKTEK